MTNNKFNRAKLSKKVNRLKKNQLSEGNQKRNRKEQFNSKRKLLRKMMKRNPKNLNQREEDQEKNKKYFKT